MGTIPNKRNRNLIISEISDERDRQILKEGYEPYCDDRHSEGQLAMAAACYAAPAPIFRAWLRQAWPWGKEYDKRNKHPRRRQLIIAAALLIAEIERYDYAEELRTHK